MHLSDIFWLHDIRNCWSKVFDIWWISEDLYFGQCFLGSKKVILAISRILICLGSYILSSNEKILRLEPTWLTALLTNDSTNWQKKILSTLHSEWWMTGILLIHKWLCMSTTTKSTVHGHSITFSVKLFGLINKFIKHSSQVGGREDMCLQIFPIIITTSSF